VKLGDVRTAIETVLADSPDVEGPPAEIATRAARDRSAQGVNRRPRRVVGRQQRGARDQEEHPGPAGRPEGVLQVLRGRKSRRCCRNVSVFSGASHGSWGGLGWVTASSRADRQLFVNSRNSIPDQPRGMQRCRLCLPGCLPSNRTSWRRLLTSRLRGQPSEWARDVTHSTPRSAAIRGPDGRL
jgi:hypothetical protein